MANNRMYLVHDASGQRVLLAKHFGDRWTIWDNDVVDGSITDAFKAEAEHSGWPSTGWHLEFEHHSKTDDPLQHSTSETWQDANWQWHLSKGESIKIDQYEKQSAMNVLLAELHVYGVPEHLRKAVEEIAKTTDLHTARIAEALKDKATLAELRQVYGLCVVPIEQDAARARDAAAGLASLRAMREALVKLRDRLAVSDTDEALAPLVLATVAQEIDEVLAVAALVMAPVQAMSASPSSQRPILKQAIEAAQIGAVDPELKVDTALVDHRRRTIEALLTAIDRELRLGVPGNALLTEAGGRAAVERIAVFARAVALLAGAPV